MGRIRYWGGRLRRFGFKKTLYNIKYNKWDKLLPYDAFHMTDEETAELIKAAEETGLVITSDDEVSGIAVNEKDAINCATISRKEPDYIMHVPKSMTSAPAIRAYIAVTAARHLALYGKLPTLIYWDDSDIVKPDYAPETLCGFNYIGSSVAIRSDMYPNGGFDADRPHTMLLRILGNCDDSEVAHVRRILTAGSQEGADPGKDSISEHANAVSNCPEDASDAIKAFLMSRKVEAEVIKKGDTYEWNPVLNEHPLVSILIANKDNSDVLRTCIDSIVSKSSYDNYEIIVIENNSREAETFDYYDEIEDIARVITMETEFNYSYINDYGAAFARGQYLLFLNNDTEVITPDWIEQMLSYASMPGIGAVGAKLYYPDGTIQHGGVTIGIRGVAGHAFIGFPGDSQGYAHRLTTVQNLSAVTAACMMVKADVFWEAGGFDMNYKVAFNDSDLCLCIRNCGYRILFIPTVELTHYESRSRGRDEIDPRKLKRFNRESDRFQREWFYQLIDGDPYYNPNLSYSDDGFNPR